MSKKITTISIDENILYKAKKEIPNLSIWVEDCLKAYFGETKIHNIDENLNTIRDCLLQIHLASKTERTEIEVETFDNKEKDKVWSKIFRPYRNGLTPDYHDLETASKVLNVDIISLNSLLEDLELNVSKMDLIECESWNVAKKYLK